MESASLLVSSLREWPVSQPVMEWIDGVDPKTWKWLALGTVVAIPVTVKIVEFLAFVRDCIQINGALKQLPGPPRHFLRGTVHPKFYHGANRLEFALELTNKDGFNRCFSIFLGPFLAGVTLTHPETVKVIMKSSQPKRLAGDKRSMYALLEPWLGDGLLLSNGDKWFRNRRLLTPAFHFDILRGYMDVYNTASNIMLDKIDKISCEGKSVELFDVVSPCSLEIILKCAFSFEGDIQKSSDENEYLKVVSTLSELLVERGFKPLLRLNQFLFSISSLGRKTKRACDYAHNVAENIIDSRRQVLTKNPDSVNKRYLDFLDILLSARDESGRGLTDIEIRHEVDTFLFEGHDTTKSGTSWVLYNLAAHPEIQEKARQEVDSILDARPKDQQDITWDDLNRLPYLTQCIKESLRLHPPVTFVGRQLDQETQLEGVTLQPGTMIGLNIYAVHHNEVVWGKDHMEFKPDRMHIDKTKDMDSYAFIPFAAGPRNCIGQNFAMNELKVLTAKTLHRFTMTVKPGHTPEPFPTVILRAKNGIWINFKPRM